MVLLALLLVIWQVATDIPDDPLRTLAAQLSDPDEATRERATAELREMGDSAVPGLLAMIDPVESFYHGWLRQYLPEEYRPPLFADRVAAFHALEILGAQAESAIPEMIARLDGRRYPQRAANVLVAIGPAAVAPVCRTLQTSTAVNKQIQLIRILGDLGTNAASVVPEILARVAAPQADVRAAAAMSLGKIRAQPAEAIPNLQKLLHDEAALVRAQAAIALGEFGPTATGATLELLEATTDPDALVRLSAMNALLRFNDPRAAEIALRQLAEDPDPENRAAARAATLNRSAHPQ